MGQADIISSRHHPLCKFVRGLDTPRRQRAYGLFIASGENAVLAALGANWPLERLIAAQNDPSNDWPSIARAADIPLYLVDTAILAYLGDLPSRPEVLALARLPEPVTTGLAATGMTLILDGISDPGNMGALVRTADAVGVTAIFASQNSCDPFNAKAVRASAGSIFHIPPHTWDDEAAGAAIAQMQADSVSIVVGVAHDGQNCFSYRWPARCVLILGHETRGAGPVWQAAANARVTIPMHGRAESLNVAAAGAVLMYAWRTQQEAAR